MDGWECVVWGVKILEMRLLRYMKVLEPWVGRDSVEEPRMVLVVQHNPRADIRPVTVNGRRT